MVLHSHGVSIFHSTFSLFTYNVVFEKYTSSRFNELMQMNSWVLICMQQIIKNMALIVRNNIQPPLYYSEQPSKLASYTVILNLALLNKTC